MLAASHARAVLNASGGQSTVRRTPGAGAGAHDLVSQLGAVGRFDEWQQRTSQHVAGMSRPMFLFSGYSAMVRKVKRKTESDFLAW